MIDRPQRDSLSNWRSRWMKGRRKEEGKGGGGRVGGGRGFLKKENRTYDLCLRRAALYPAELRVRSVPISQAVQKLKRARVRSGSGPPAPEHRPSPRRAGRGRSRHSGSAPPAWSLWTGLPSPWPTGWPEPKARRSPCRKGGRVGRVHQHQPRAGGRTGRLSQQLGQCPRARQVAGQSPPPRSSPA